MDITDLPTEALKVALDRALDGQRQEWTVAAMLDELERRDAFGEDVHGTMSAWHHHHDRGEEPCAACQAAFTAREASHEARLARERARRSPKRRARDASFAELHGHWLEVLEDEAHGRPHRCQTCPGGAR